MPVKMFWEDHGGSGPGLLLVHGFLCSAAQWALNIPGLREFCRPITVELWGHGRSPAPTQPECYEPSCWVQQFDEIRAELAIQRWFVLGYSLGAGATIRYALTHPQRTLGHIFTNSASGLADLAQLDATKAAANADKILKGGREALERIPVHPRHAKRLPAAVYDGLMRDAAELDPVAIANIMRYSTAALSVRDKLGDNASPALLICGLREKRFLPSRAYAAAHMPALEIVDLDVGHGVNMEDVDGFNQSVRTFVEKWQNIS